jgi:uncharacterized lipoprotein YddW (UPF0748 family)
MWRNQNSLLSWRGRVTRKDEWKLAVRLVDCDSAPMLPIADVVSKVGRGLATSFRNAHWAAHAAFLLLVSDAGAASYQFDSTIEPPPVQREFRAAWIPTVGNSCWPSKPGLSTAQQKAELVALLDRAAELKLNAVIFQIRPACDALYKSDLEPWSEYLTGVQGAAPSPYYDPLAFAVTEAHKRGLELHAWLNPFRARHTTAKSGISPSHISRKRPDLIRHYGPLLWLDPGEPEVQNHVLRVVMDVVRRYDVDAIHFDDYFYPYPEKSGDADIDFPDGASWFKYGTKSGLSRNDWRRRNVDQFVRRVYQSVHAEKPQLKVGFSPFGIWRPKVPAGIEGLDAYDKLYADARKWLREGWCDYLAPQLYWAIEPKAQSFPALFNWWKDENVRQRHIWPGINSLKVGNGWNAEEISRQIQITRQQSAAAGHIHWSEAALMKNANLRDELASEDYRQSALVPRSQWLKSSAPGRPAAAVVTAGTGVTLTWSPTALEKPWLWVVQTKEFGDWKTRILPGDKSSQHFNFQPETVAVSAVDRCGNQSAPAVLKLAK